ncbi:AcrR family transcriptional regulator [Mumia flava]|uniref:AcrR family transcriptional regulator n=1 Tax=Mumia flava TaxID=1348852 RepID=A0A2M9B8M9_9ACTN|nr:TetR/AcrR family transcriptional regulator [Mumia flava]PJJ54278.1 AcrR family transcriptional regulator [Mumia flava]
MASKLGRPRAQGPSTSGLTTEEDILVAAAALFCESGYGSTSTHAIARAAGISQASMYHYFAGKHAILLELLLATVRPSTAFAASVADAEADAETRLWALCAYDVHLLLSGQENTASLYLLPELADERFAEFHAERQRLFGVYRTLVGAVLGVGPEDAQEEASLVFGLVESTILRRRNEPEMVVRGAGERLADAALRLLGADSATIERAHTAGTALVRPAAG